MIVPDFIYSIFGASLTAGGVFAAREYGASMMGNLMLAWLIVVLYLFFALGFGYFLIPKKKLEEGN